MAGGGARWAAREQTSKRGWVLNRNRYLGPVAPYDKCEVWDVALTLLWRAGKSGRGMPFWCSKFAWKISRKPFGTNRSRTCHRTEEPSLQLELQHCIFT